MVNTTSTPFRVALISMPWPIFNRPSVQLGALKSFLEQQPGLTVDCYHPFLNIAESLGMDVYREIGHNGWAGEALFSPLLFPEKEEDARKLFSKSFQGTGKKFPEFDDLIERIDTTCTNWLSEVTLQQYSLIGFSACFNQLLPSLYLADQIKKKNKAIPIVMGGSSCVGELGTSLIDTFNQIDFVIDGEGEKALHSLCKFLSGTEKSLPKKIYTKKNVPRIPAETMVDIGTLPYPDYSPYFKEIRRIFPHQPFIPVLPIEFSRGCWWNKCTFCNLNVQWQNYRYKRGNRMAEEALQLSKTYECLHFTFTDNALPPKETDQFFSTILKEKIDFDFFAEIRCITRPKTLQLYRRGGLSTVQVGIEALSSSLLAKMTKGTRVIDNMAVMKLCSETSIKLEGNLITEFPSSTEREVDETMTNLDFILPFPPLDAATFFLGYGSPVHTRYKDFSIRAIVPHSKNRLLYPKNHLQTTTMLLNDYRGNRVNQRKLWRPVKKKILAWQKFHQERSQKKSHPLSYRDGGTYLIIRQEIITGSPLLHRLRGLSRKIYLFCETPCSLDTILREFPKITKKALTHFMDEMHSKRLIFCEDEMVLSLAVRAEQKTS